MLINVYVNGDWDTSLETQKEVVIFNRGIIYQMDEKLFDSFINFSFIISPFKINS